jgi:hypothetical protein
MSRKIALGLAALGILIAALGYFKPGFEIIDGHVALETHNPAIVKAVTKFDGVAPAVLRIDFIHSPSYAQNGKDWSKLEANNGIPDSLMLCQDNTSINDRTTVCRAYENSTGSYMKVFDRYGGGWVPKGSEYNREFHQTGTDTGFTPDFENADWGPRNYH